MKFRYAGSLLLSLLLVSCSAFTERDVNTRAILDYESNQIIYPLDEYYFSLREEDVMLEAYSVLRVSCLREKGYPDLKQQPIPQRMYNTYGAWSPDYAKKYGYGQNKSQESSDWDKSYSVIPSSVAAECRKEHRADFDRLDSTSHDNEDGRFVAKLRSEAYNNAQKTPEWRQAREKWWACLSDKGLTPNKQDGKWGTQELDNLRSRTTNQDGSQADMSQEDKTEEIRIATIAAECNVSTGMAQTLADVEASYQMPLIRKNQVKLNEIKERKGKSLEFARTIIATKQ
ncbi:MAG: hypothetical protein Q4P78_04520 [Rothia sp. (in: high G+C Gram-positive bacteria)]|uniref:hypothetical protein n=1 Tax=Rothia sp. (in: high G+C Gram-positive bacteria) TaxID=1885016 RepID=UPI0026DF995D|nr:hypothetical protein [Rothia sp. (in: high G+C Gram-positive bacteria)]MDO5750454.1 hypothetical protein [Rothia sp. (in: high G+C Gram-positive bacteria)]